MSNKFENKTMRDTIREQRTRDTENQLRELTERIESEGYAIEYGNIGMKTTYCLLSKADGEEVVGYTFIRDINYKNELVGKLKSLQQAVTRKELLEEKDSASNS